MNISSKKLATNSVSDALLMILDNMEYTLTYLLKGIKDMKNWLWNEEFQEHPDQQLQNLETFYTHLIMRNTHLIMRNTALNALLSKNIFYLSFHMISRVLVQQQSSGSQTSFGVGIWAASPKKKKSNGKKKAHQKNWREKYKKITDKILSKILQNTQIAMTFMLSDTFILSYSKLAEVNSMCQQITSKKEQDIAFQDEEDLIIEDEQNPIVDPQMALGQKVGKKVVNWGKKWGGKVVDLGKAVWNRLFGKKDKDNNDSTNDSNDSTNDSNTSDDEKETNTHDEEEDKDKKEGTPANQTSPPPSDSTNNKNNPIGKPQEKKDEEKRKEDSDQEGALCNKLSNTSRFCTAQMLEAIPSSSDIISSQDYINWLSYFNVRKPWTKRVKSLNPWVMIDGTMKSPLPFDQRKYFTCWSTIKGSYSLPESGFQYE